MYDVYFTFRSITGAQRGQRALQKEKVRCSFLRTPKAMSVNGCGYALKVRQEEALAAQTVLGIWGIEYKNIYRVYKDGRMEQGQL